MRKLLENEWTLSAAAAAVPPLQSFLTKQDKLSGGFNPSQEKCERCVRGWKDESERKKDNEWVCALGECGLDK